MFKLPTNVVFLDMQQYIRIHFNVSPLMNIFQEGYQ
jgi:hypothetical protein